MSRISKSKGKLRFALLAVVILLLVFCTACDNADQPTENANQYGVSVHFIDVGQGDSIFIGLPDNKSMLIDAGENTCGDTVIDYILSTGEDRLDYVVATHPHSDHIGGMTKVINKFEIGTFYMPDCSHTTKTFENMLDALIQNQVDTQIARKGVTICNDGNVKIEILSPAANTFDDLNNYSAVVKLTYGDVSYLFTGDAETDAENLITDDVSADVLKVGHHGSATSTGMAFLKRVNPQIAVISSGADNSYGHPDFKVVQRLENYGVKIFRTDTDGTVIISTDGKDIYRE